MIEAPEIQRLPRGDDGDPVFNAPWEATAFALTVRLHQQGCFTWPEWAGQLSAEIDLARQRGDADLGDSYYQHWLCALEKLIVSKGLASQSQLTQLKRDWTDAAAATAHGQPIELKTRPSPR